MREPWWTASRKWWAVMTSLLCATDVGFVIARWPRITVNDVGFAIIMHAVVGLALGVAYAGLRWG